MTRYISNPDNLKLMMNMLKEKSRNIQFEAFHVFKVFVANPNKPKPILDILLRNQEKLVDFLTKFHTDRSEDEQFNDEKAYLIKQIKVSNGIVHGLVRQHSMTEPMPLLGLSHCLRVQLSKIADLVFPLLGHQLVSGSHCSTSIDGPYFG